MARIFTQTDAKRLGLPGREVVEIVSGEKGARSVTLRLVTIPVVKADDPLRGQHQHTDFEECIFVLSGTGVTVADTGLYPLTDGDAILIPAGEKHVTRNIGNVPLRLLCFFPVADITTRTEEPGTSSCADKS